MFEQEDVNASFNTASREVASNGGTWFAVSHSPATIVPHQSMGEMTDLIQLNGHMEAQVIIPSDVAQIGDTIIQSFTYNACEVKMDGDTRTSAKFDGHDIPFCPTMSETIARPVIPFILRNNPMELALSSEPLGSSSTTVYVGKFQFSLNLVALGLHSSPSPSAGVSGSIVANSSPFLTGSAPTPSTSAAANVPQNGTQSPAAIASVATLSNGSTKTAPLSFTANFAPSAATSSSSVSGIIWNQSSTPVDSNNNGRVTTRVGGMIGGIAFLATVLILILLTLRRKRRQECEKLDSLDGGDLGIGGASDPLDASESLDHCTGHYGSRSSLGSDRTSNFTNLTIALESAPSTHLPSYTHPPSYTQSSRSHMGVDNMTQPMIANGTRPVDADRLIDHANGSRDRE